MCSSSIDFAGSEQLSWVGILSSAWLESAQVRSGLGSFLSQDPNRPLSFSADFCFPSTVLFSGSFFRRRGLQLVDYPGTPLSFSTDFSFLSTVLFSWSYFRRRGLQLVDSPGTPSRCESSRFEILFVHRLLLVPVAQHRFPRVCSTCSPAQFHAPLHFPVAWVPAHF
jgi:hypothetical protein